MDESKITKSLEIYALDAAYGRAMLEAHTLELFLSNLLILGLVDNGLSKEQYNSECNKIKKKTMGRLISGVIGKYEVSNYLQQELDNCLFFRNRLAHQISDDIISSHMNGDGKNGIIIELGEISGYFIETKEELEKLINTWLKTKGIKRSKINDLARGLLEKMEANSNALLHE